MALWASETLKQIASAPNRLSIDEKSLGLTLSELQLPTEITKNYTLNTEVRKEFIRIFKGGIKLEDQTNALFNQYRIRDAR